MLLCKHEKSRSGARAAARGASLLPIFGRIRQNTDSRNAAGDEDMKQLTPSQLERLKQLITEGREDLFYSWRIWRDHIKPEVFRLDKTLCQKCKTRGKVKRATVAHHVKHLRDAPELAASIFDPDTGERQIISLCKSCHEEEHPEALRPPKEPAQPLTAERWD